MSIYRDAAKELIRSTLESHGVPYNEEEVELELQRVELEELAKQNKKEPESSK